MKTNYRDNVQKAWVIQAKTPTLFCGNVVNLNELYGSFGGVHFITKPYATAVGVYPSMMILNNGSKWVRICPTKISAFLLEAVYQHRIQVWKIKSKSEKQADSAKRCENACITVRFLTIAKLVFVGLKARELVVVLAIHQLSSRKNIRLRAKKSTVARLM